MSYVMTVFIRENVYVCLTGGKRDEELILPVNSSLSATLSQEEVNYPFSKSPYLSTIFITNI